MLPKTNSLHLKQWGWKMSFLWGFGLFSGVNCSFQGGYLATSTTTTKFYWADPKLELSTLGWVVIQPLKKPRQKYLTKKTTKYGARNIPSNVDEYKLTLEVVQPPSNQHFLEVGFRTTKKTAWFGTSLAAEQNQNMSNISPNESFEVLLNGLSWQGLLCSRSASSPTEKRLTFLWD